jgi:prepilin-type N-terminal cleavage/methylation domain-containing protein
MKTFHPLRRSWVKCCLGFTLLEMMIAIAVGMTVVGTVVSLSIVSAQNFMATSNYVQMNDQSRNAVDRIGREVRNATALLASSNPQSIQLTNAALTTVTSIDYNPALSTLTMTKTGQGAQTLLTGCTNFQYQIFTRAPYFITNNISSNNIYFTPSGSAQFCKIINLNWKCFRTIRGSPLNTEFVQTAQVVLRNQVSQ